LKAKTVLALVAVALAALPGFAHRPAPPASRSAAARDPRHVSGAVHVHTGWSDDAHGSVDEVAAAARAAGLDFVIVTDHNSAASLGPFGYRHGVLVIGGLEKSTDAGHALLLGMGSLPFGLDGDPATVVRDATDLGGFVVIAHPEAARPDLQWTADAEGAAGYEVISLGDVQTWGAATLPLLLAAARYPFDPQGALLSIARVPRAALDRFDRERERRPLAAILGSDAHGGLVSHRALFRLARQHLLLDRPLTGQPRADEALVLAALRTGRGYAAFDALADAARFSFTAASGGRSAALGEAVALVDDIELAADVDGPAGAVLVLRRDGREVARGPSLRVRSRAAGSYRVEAELPRGLVPGGHALPWIVSNPIDVYPAAELAARERRAAARPPLDAPLPAGGTPLDTFDAPALDAKWQIDRSADSAAALALDEGALRFSFRLGRGAAPHVSVCRWEPRDLTGASALTFRVRGDRRFRFDVQVRATHGNELRIFRRSVRAESAWRTTGVLLHELRSYDRAAGVPDLARVAGVYFHVDAAHLPRGAAGTLWIDDVRTAP
jgi:hypothetical protein